MRENGRFPVRFLMSHNLPGSITRIIADTASIFVQLGVPTTVLFPAVDWWDFKLFTLHPRRPLSRCKGLLRLAGEVASQVPFRRRWCGLRYHKVDSRVKTERFLLTPSARPWTEEGITLVHPPYVIPHLLGTLSHPKIKMVSAIHVNLEKAIQSPCREVAAWFTHWVAMERYLSIPRYATSQEAFESAQRLGIPIRKVIYGGIDLHLFHPSRIRPHSGPLVISLYCDPNIQKGRAEGVEAVTGIKSEAPDVRLCSVGKVTSEQARRFDHNYGYLHGEAYAQALRTSDIFVYPSLYDGFPAPPLQAMASGAALVTTSVEGVREYAVDEQNALVCTPGDSRMMHRQILRLVGDEPLRKKLQTNGCKTAEKFSMEASARQLLDFLQEVYYEREPLPVVSTVTS